MTSSSFGLFLPLFDNEKHGFSTRLMKQILLTFDVEEFDIPNEYGAQLSMTEQLKIGTEGLHIVQQMLLSLDIPTTLFTTGLFAENNVSLIQQLSKKNEIASHGYAHGDADESLILQSKQILESITQDKVYGYRSPRMAPINHLVLSENGFEYDATSNPTYLPGRYNHLSQPRTIHQKNNLTIIPASVTPRLRIPLFWLLFKNLPMSLIKKWTSNVLEHDGYLVLYFHPWEFCDLRHYDLPFYVKRIDHTALQERFMAYCTWLKTKGEFSTIHHFLQSNA